MIVLDTRAWVWFVSNPELLSKAAKKAIDASMEQKGIFISSISAWEVALLTAKKRLKLSIDVADWIGIYVIEHGPATYKRLFSVSNPFRFTRHSGSGILIS